MRIAVTGASGFVGGELVSYLCAQGHEVIRLRRKSISGPMDRFFDVRSITSIPDLTGIDALIHTAYIRYDRKNIPDSSEINIRTTLALEKACHKAGTKFIFLSTMSAHSEAASHYGKHKYEIEQRLNQSKDLIFRLGIVIGNGGIFDRIKSQVAKGLFIPLADGHHAIQIIAVTDVCRIIEKAIVTMRTGTYTLASEKAYTVKGIYKAIAKRLNKKPVFVRVPFGTSKESLFDLHLQTFDTKKDPEKLGVSILDLDQALDQLMGMNSK
jgi:NADH dehydrogenase